jgi:hypothetical protein
MDRIAVWDGVMSAAGPMLVAHRGKLAHQVTFLAAT